MDQEIADVLGKMHDSEAIKEKERGDLEKTLFDIRSLNQSVDAARRVVEQKVSPLSFPPHSSSPSVDDAYPSLTRTEPEPRGGQIESEAIRGDEDIAQRRDRHQAERKADRRRARDAGTTQR